MIENLTRQLVEEEGEVLHAYQDHLGMWTLGVGRLIDKRKGGGISKEESRHLLMNDINRFTRDVSASLPWFSTLDDARKAVLVGMAFQMGLQGLLAFKNTLAHVKAGRYIDAADGMLQSLWARQTPARAKRMALQMKTGEWQFK
jgi:lysozyme